MSNINEKIKEMSFPKSGDLFAVFPLIGLIANRQTGDGTTIQETRVDRSYREDVFQCLESDATRVVCRKIDKDEYGKKPIVFHRSEWRIDNINHLLPALGFAVPEEQAR